MEEQAEESTPEMKEMMEHEMNILMGKIFNPNPNYECDVCERTRKRKANDFNPERDCCFSCQMRELIRTIEMQRNGRK